MDTLNPASYFSPISWNMESRVAAVCVVFVTPLSLSISGFHIPTISSAVGKLLVAKDRTGHEPPERPDIYVKLWSKPPVRCWLAASSLSSRARRAPVPVNAEANPPPLIARPSVGTESGLRWEI